MSGRILAFRLQAFGYDVITTSHRQNKLLRLAHMLWTIWHQRNHYQLAQIDVFSGQAFTWAYLSGGLLKKLNNLLSSHCMEEIYRSFQRATEIKYSGCSSRQQR